MGKTQAVIDEGGGCSGWLATSSWVPQGSVLCPLLFTLCINDICSSLKFSQHMIFADDTRIYPSYLSSELDRGINLIAHDVGVMPVTPPVTALSWTTLNPRISYLGRRAFICHGGLMFFSSVHGENFMEIFTTHSVIIRFSTGTLGIFAILVYVFTMLLNSGRPPSSPMLSCPVERKIAFRSHSTSYGW